MDVNPKLELYGFQRVAVSRAYRRPSIMLVLPTGAGKTIVSLVIAARKRRKVLVFTRKNLIYQWAREIEFVLGTEAKVWTPKCTNIDKISKRGRAAFESADIILTNYDKAIGLRKTLADWVTTHGAGVILDEIQYCRSHHRWIVEMAVDGTPDFARDYTTRASAVEYIAHRGLYRVGLSATPQATGRETLWSPLSITFPGEVGGFKDWSSRYAGRTTGEYGVVFSGPTNSPELKRWLAPRSAVVSASEVAKDMPPLSIGKTVIPVSEQMTAGIREEFKEVMRKAARQGPMALMEARVAESTFRKRDYLKFHVLAHLKSKRNVAIIVNRVRECKWLYETLRKLAKRKSIKAKFMRYEGDMNETARQEAVNEWMFPVTPVCLILTEQAGGVGLNLDNADQVYSASIPSNVETAVQVRGRFHRLSTKRKVRFEYLVAENSYDTRIMELLGDRLLGAEDLFNDEVASSIADALTRLAETDLQATLTKLLNQ